MSRLFVFCISGLAALAVTLTLATERGFADISATDSATPASKDEFSLSQQELLGKRIFEDTNLSEPKGTSCASCHDPRHAFQGNNHSPLQGVAQGSKHGTFGTRNVPTLMYSAFSPAFSFAEEMEDGKKKFTPTGGQFLDGRADTLAKQLEGPFLGAREMNNPSKDAIVEKVRQSRYAPLMEQAFGTDIFSDKAKAFDAIATAVAAFENTARFKPFSSKFDDYLRGKTKLSALEMKGFELFKDKDKGNCISCHVGKPESHDPQDWLFTDFTYDALGLPRNMDIPDNKNGEYYDLGLCAREGIAAVTPKDVPQDSLCGAFKVPTLRNIEVTGPYMHNGVFRTLKEAVEFYATRDTSPERWFPKSRNGKIDKFNDLPEKYHGNVNTDEVPYDRKQGEKPRLSAEEIDAMVAYLKTLTDQPGAENR